MIFASLLVISLQNRCR
ncbi:hypothetical protein [Yersinia sp. 2542 StPb PI]